MTDLNHQEKGYEDLIDISDLDVEEGQVRPVDLHSLIPAVPHRRQALFSRTLKWMDQVSSGRSLR